MAVSNQIPYPVSLAAELEDSQVSQHLSEKLPPHLNSLASPPVSDVGSTPGTSPIIK